MNQDATNIDRIEGFITARELKERGSYYKAVRATPKGELIKVRHGVYAQPDSLVSNMVDVETLVPGGVVCMYSAWSFYGLTTTVAAEICIAIKANRKIVLPDIVPISIYYWKEEYLGFGITTCDYSGFRVKITDIERSVCDALRYRNKIGLDLCTEILVSYLKRTDRNLTRLANYSKKLRVGRILNTYLDIYLQ